MSSGIVHAKSSAILSIGFLAVPLFSGNIHDLEYSIGALFCIMISPDWDVDNGFVGDKIIRTKVGRFFEKLFKIFLHTYRKSLKHGSPLSHFPVVGTLGRIGYMYLFLIVFPELALKLLFPSNLNLTHELTWWINIILMRYKFIIAMMAGDLIHWALDIITTEHKDK